MTRRVERASEVLKREVANFIAKEMRIEGALITITRVEISSDLHYADIYFACIPDSSAEKCLRAFRRDIFFTQQALNKRLRMRPVPKISFHIDKQEEEAAKIERIISHLHE